MDIIHEQNVLNNLDNKKRGTFEEKISPLFVFYEKLCIFAKVKYANYLLIKI